MSKKSNAARMVPITATDMERFRRNLPAALARREGDFLAVEITRALRMAITGLVPIAGLLWWGWSGVEMLAFLLVGAWVGITLDAVKYVLLRERAEAFAAAMYDDWHVWVVTEALRQGKTKAPEQHLRAKWQPVVGILVDLVFGGVGTVAVLAMLSEAGVRLPGFTDTGFVVAVVATIVLGVLSAAWEVVAYYRQRPSKLLEDQTAGPPVERPVRLMPGVRGIGLFLLLFVVALLKDSEGVVATRAMLVVNGLLMLLATISVVGALGTLRETQWLRDYRDKHGL